MKLLGIQQVSYWNKENKKGKVDENDDPSVQRRNAELGHHISNEEKEKKRVALKYSQKSLHFFHECDKRGYRVERQKDCTN